MRQTFLLLMLGACVYGFVQVLLNLGNYDPTTSSLLLLVFLLNGVSFAQGIRQL